MPWVRFTKAWGVMTPGEEIDMNGPCAQELQKRGILEFIERETVPESAMVDPAAETAVTKPARARKIAKGTD